MSRGQRLTMHGRDHRPGGADPIPGLSGGGIQFDIDNEGGWLEIGTSSGQDSDSGYGINLFDSGTGGSLGISLGANGGAGVSVNVVGGGEILLQSTGGIEILELGGAGTTGMTLRSSTGFIDIESKKLMALDSDGGITLSNTSGGVAPILLDGHGVDGSGNAVIIDIHNSGTLLVRDGTFAQDLLKVFFNGVTYEYHMLTGATWAADL